MTEFNKDDAFEVSANFRKLDPNYIRTVQPLVENSYLALDQAPPHIERRFLKEFAAFIPGPDSGVEVNVLGIILGSDPVGFAVDYGGVEHEGRMGTVVLGMVDDKPETKEILMAKLKVGVITHPFGIDQIEQVETSVEAGVAVVCERIFRMRKMLDEEQREAFEQSLKGKVIGPKTEDEDADPK